MACWALSCKISVGRIWKTGLAPTRYGGTDAVSLSLSRSRSRHHGLSTCSSHGYHGPLLMIPPGVVADQPIGDDDNDFYHFFSVAEQRVIKSRKKKILGLPDDDQEEAHCVGSSHGWLAFQSKSFLSLVNPFPSSSLNLPYSIPLPPIVGGASVKKLILSACPYDNSQNCMAMAIIGPSRDLAFCLLGDTKWIILEGTRKNYYREVIYSNKDRCFYVMGGQFEDDGHDYPIEAWNLATNSRPLEKTVIRPSFLGQMWCLFDQEEFKEFFVEKRYLVEFLEDLFLVARCINKRTDHQRGCLIPEDYYEDGDEWTYNTCYFSVYKYDRGQNKWEYVESIANEHRSLFVGLNHSFSDVAHGHILEDRVYYTDDFFEKMHQLHSSGGHDLGVQGLHWIKRDTKLFPCSLRRIQPSPVWVHCPAQSLF